MAVNTWSSAGSTDGNLAGNWSLHAPQTTDVLTFDATSTVNCTFTASFTCGGFNQAAAYTGTIDAATHDITGDDGADFIFDGTGLDLGSGTWAITNGTFDLKDVGTCTYGTSTVEMNATCVIIGNASNDLFALTINGAVTLSASTTTRQDVRGGLIINSGKSLTLDANLDLLGSSSTITGELICNSRCYIRNSATLTNNGTVSGTDEVQMLSATVTNNGTWTVALTTVNRTNTFGPGNCGSATVALAHAQSGLAHTLTILAGSHSFSGDVTISTIGTGNDYTLDCSTNAVTGVTITGDLTIDIDSTGDIIIDNSGRAVVWDIEGDVIDEVTGGGTLVWTAGTADPEITATGTVAQDWDWDGVSIGKTEIDKSADTMTLSGAFNPNTLTLTDGDLDINGQTITTTGILTAASGFTFNTGDADSLNGCSIIVGGALTLDGQTLNATAGWTLTVTGAATANNIGEVEHSNAGGGTEIDASAGPWTDGGNNTNWNFGGGFAGSVIIIGGGFF